MGILNSIVCTMYIHFSLLLLPGCAQGLLLDSAQGSLPKVLKGSYAVLEIEPRSASHKHGKHPTSLSIFLLYLHVGVC